MVGRVSVLPGSPRRIWSEDRRQGERVVQSLRVTISGHRDSTSTSVLVATGTLHTRYRRTLPYRGVVE